MLVGALGLSGIGGGVGYMLGKPSAVTPTAMPTQTAKLNKAYLQCLHDNLAAVVKAQEAKKVYGTLEEASLQGAILKTHAPGDSNWVTLDFESNLQIAYRGQSYTDEAIGNAWMLNAGIHLPQPVMLTSGIGSALAAICKPKLKVHVSYKNDFKS